MDNDEIIFSGLVTPLEIQFWILELAQFPFLKHPIPLHEISQVLEGNSNTHEVKKNIIPVIQARYVLLIPLKWHNWTCARMEFYGEPWPEGEIA